MDHVFLTFVDSLHDDADVPKLSLAMAAGTGAFDIGAFAYLCTGRQPKSEVKLISNYTTAWTSHYLANSYEEIDTVMDRAVQTCEPFPWGREFGHSQLGALQIQLLEDRRILA